MQHEKKVFKFAGLLTPLPRRVRPAARMALSQQFSRLNGGGAAQTGLAAFFLAQLNYQARGKLLRAATLSIRVDNDSTSHLCGAQGLMRHLGDGRVEELPEVGMCSVVRDYPTNPLTPYHQAAPAVNAMMAQSPSEEHIQVHTLSLLLDTGSTYNLCGSQELMRHLGEGRVEDLDEVVTLCTVGGRVLVRQCVWVRVRVCGEGAEGEEGVIRFLVVPGQLPWLLGLEGLRCLFGNDGVLPLKGNGATLALQVHFEPVGVPSYHAVLDEMQVDFLRQLHQNNHHWDYHPSVKKFMNLDTSELAFLRELEGHCDTCWDKKKQPPHSKVGPAAAKWETLGKGTTYQCDIFYLHGKAYLRLVDCFSLFTWMWPVGLDALTTTNHLREVILGEGIGGLIICDMGTSNFGLPAMCQELSKTTLLVPDITVYQAPRTCAWQLGIIEGGHRRAKQYLQHYLKEHTDGKACQMACYLSNTTPIPCTGTTPTCTITPMLIQRGTTTIPLDMACGSAPYMELAPYTYLEQAWVRMMSGSGVRMRERMHRLKYNQRRFRRFKGYQGGVRGQWIRVWEEREGKGKWVMGTICCVRAGGYLVQSLLHKGYYSFVHSRAVPPLTHPMVESPLVPYCSAPTALPLALPLEVAPTVVVPPVSPPAPAAAPPVPPVPPPSHAADTAAPTVPDSPPSNVCFVTFRKVPPADWVQHIVADGMYLCTGSRARVQGRRPTPQPGVTICDDCHDRMQARSPTPDRPSSGCRGCTAGARGG